MAAADLPLALRRTPRRGRQHGGEEEPRTPAPASSRRNSQRGSVARKTPAAPRKITAKTTGKTPTMSKRSKASVPEACADVSAAAAADDATDDSVTLVDDADDSITALDFDIPTSSRPSSTGTVGKRKRRPSVTSTPSGAGNRAIKKARRHNNENTPSSVVHILPLRMQILDDHIKRRIRRNGLSAEMNEAYGEKRARRERTLAELRRARDELRLRDAEIERLRELTALFEGHNRSQTHRGGDEDEGDSSRVRDLERELSRLKDEVAGRRGSGRGRVDHDVSNTLSSSPPVARADDGDDGWGVMGGISDDDEDFDHEFGDTSVAELESGGTPAQHRHHRSQQQLTAKRPPALHLHGPALTPPSTSPAKLPSSPARSSGSSSEADKMRASSGCDAAAQACMPDPAVDMLNEELTTLRAEVAGLGDALSERDTLRARMAEKLACAAQGSSMDQDLELQLDIVLQDLGDKTTLLAELSSLLMAPASGGDNNSATVITRDNSSSSNNKQAMEDFASALQSVRAALSDLSPDDDDTPLPPAAASALALAAARLRDLDNTLKQCTAALSAAEASARGERSRAANLESDVAHLGATVSSLREAVADLQASAANQQADLDEARDAALQRGLAAAKAEARLASAVAQIGELEARLAEREEVLRGREGEVEGLRTALAEARETVMRLREGAASDKAAAREAVRAMRARMMAAMSIGEGFLAGVEEGVAKEEEEAVGGVDVRVVVGGGVDKTPRGRSDDSGLGL